MQVTLINVSKMMMVNYSLQELYMSDDNDIIAEALDNCKELHVEGCAITFTGAIL